MLATVDMGINYVQDQSATSVIEMRRAADILFTTGNSRVYADGQPGVTRAPWEFITGCTGALGLALIGLEVVAIKRFQRRRNEAAKRGDHHRRRLTAEPQTPRKGHSSGAFRCPHRSDCARLRTGCASGRRTPESADFIEVSKLQDRKPFGSRSGSSTETIVTEEFSVLEKASLLSGKDTWRNRGDLPNKGDRSSSRTARTVCASRSARRIIWASTPPSRQPVSPPPPP